MTLSNVDATAFQKILKRNVALPLLLTIALSAVFVGLLFNLLGANEDLMRSTQIVSKENDALRLIIDSETGLRGFLLTGKDIYLEPRVRAERAIPTAFTEIGVLVTGNASQVANLERLRTHYADWNTSAIKAVESRRKRGVPSADGADLRKDLMDQVREDFDILRTVTETARDERAAKVASNTRVSVLITVLLSILFGGGLALAGRRQLISLSRQYEGILQEQARQNAELERQAWLRSGLTTLAEKIRGDLSVEKLSTLILDFLSEYTGAKLGALFLIGEQGALVRMGGHALSPSAPTRFASGEGLIGQAALNSKVMILDELPENYTKLTSALGETLPRHLALAPITADGITQGVIELGFLMRPRGDVIEFLRQIAELAGVALRSAQFRMRLQDLLHEAQQLSEELQTQQEELRVSNEELSERTQALQDSTARLEGQQTELEQTNELLEEQAQTLESQRVDLDQRNSELEKARDALEERAEQLQAASRYKSEFLANMSHELRTPLNSSLILAKLLQDNPTGNLSEEQVHFAETIYDAGNDLLNLINDILDLSKVEAGKLELNLEKVSIPKITQGMERIFRPLADSKGLKFEIHADASLPSMTTDRQRIDQVLRNLLSNALKFTTRGTVTLEVNADGPRHIVFAVKDTGIGIDPSQHDQIFAAFHQADGTINRKFGGTGLGLSISKSLTELLGGTIEVESQKDKGSTFILRLPVATVVADTAQRDQTLRADPEVPSKAAPARKSPSASANAIPLSEVALGIEDDRKVISETDTRILLVVEDEAAFAKILFDLGHESDFKVLLAGTTADGYALAVRYLPSAVILDMKLPDASGLSLLDRLKENPKTRHIPVHGMSVTDFSREALHLGAIGFLMKPANRNELKRTLEKLQAKTAQGLKRVLVVEDDDTQRMSIEKLISDKSVELVLVGSGKEALEALTRSTFDCMIMDIRLPDMSGFQLLERMAEESDRGFPPVIVYTGHDLSRAEEDRLRRYSRSIIIKGARSPERLLDEVTLFLHQVESKLSPERQKLIQTSRNRERAFEGRSILIVDDDVRNIFALTSALENKGAKILVARNGREAIERLEESFESENRADLVLMDVMMPEMDGYEAMRRIRTQKRFEDLPMIAVTAKAMRDDYEKCIAAGANDYLAKPIDLDRLISLMRVWLPKQIGRL